MALAIWVPTRLWMGGVISPKRDLDLIQALADKVRKMALCRPLLLAVDGLVSYVSAFRNTFRSKFPRQAGETGRCKMVSWQDLAIVQVVKQRVEGILKELGVDPKGKPALDVGCGGGLLAEEFAAMGFAVTGIDPSEQSLAVARAHAAENGLQIDYRLGYGDALPFENERFDVVYCCDVLEHIPNWDAVIGEIARVLKQDGVFFYDTINRTMFSKVVVIKLAQEWRLTRFFPPNVHVWEMLITPEELTTSLERHGLRNQDLRGTNLGNPIRMIRAMWLYKQGRISGSEFGRRIGFREGANIAGSYILSLEMANPTQQMR